MATVTELLQIVQVINKIVGSLRDMGLKITGEINIAEILALIPRGQ